MSESLSKLARDSVGPLLLGTLLNVMMSGIVFIQLSTYFARYKKDPIWLKRFVLFSALLSFASSALAGYYSYYHIVIGFGDASKLPVRISESVIKTLMPHVQSVTVHVFFGWRVSRFIRNRTLLVGVIIVAPIQLGGIVVRIFLGIYWPHTVREAGVDPACLVSSALGLATDVSISAVLVYYLIKRCTGYADVDASLIEVVRLTLLTGILTAGWEFTALITCVTARFAMFDILVIAQPVLYTNSLLAALNGRLSSSVSGNEAEDVAVPVPNSPANLEKSRLIISEVTFMSLGIRSESSIDQSTMDGEIVDIVPGDESDRSNCSA